MNPFIQLVLLSSILLTFTAVKTQTLEWGGGTLTYDLSAQGNDPCNLQQFSGANTTNIPFDMQKMEAKIFRFQGFSDLCQPSGGGEAGAQSYVLASVTGLGTSTVYINWQMTAQGFYHRNFVVDFLDFACGHICPCDDIFEEASTLANGLIEVIPTGGTPGASVNLYARYHYGFINRNHPESVTDDIANLISQTNFNGQSLPYGFHQSFVSSGQYGQNAAFGFSGDMDMRIDDPPTYESTCIFDSNVRNEEDIGSVTAFGQITISLNPVPTNEGTKQLLFSLDIGSDTEWSDFNSTNNNVFDPADIYIWKSNAATPHFDDSNLMGGDPAPTVGVMGTEAPLCSGDALADIETDFLDIDGIDQINLDLRNFELGQEESPPVFADVPDYQCITDADFIQVSLEEDENRYYAWQDPGAMTFCSFPTADGLLALNGQTTPKNEVLSGLTSYNSTSSSYDIVDFGLVNEAELHPLLSPNPTMSDISGNDDIDALDNLLFHSTDIEEPMPPDCSFQYFSVDNEATLGLNAATIYVQDLNVPASFQAVVLPDHIGIADGTDIDAFEFVWLPDNSPENNNPSSFRFLGLVFSVDADDPETAVDEAGGLDPGILYVSYLDGKYELFSRYYAAEDVDALTFSCEVMAADNASLALEQIAFSAEAIEREIHLKWELPTQPHFSQLQLQRQMERETEFHTIFETNKALSSNSFFLDKDVKNGEAYLYQLRLLDEQGEVHFSPLQIAGIFGTNEIEIYPNPATAITMIKTNGQLLESIEVYHLNGQLVKTVKGNQSVEQEIVIDDLEKGIYWMKLVSIGSTTVKRLVVQ